MAPVAVAAAGPFLSPGGEPSPLEPPPSPDQSDMSDVEQLDDEEK